MKLPFLPRLSAGDLLAVIGAGLLTGVAIWAGVLFLSVTPDRMFWVGHTRNVIAIIDQLSLAVRTAEAAEATYLATGDDEQLSLYQSAIVEIPTRMDDLLQLTAERPEEQDRLRYLADLLRRERHALSRTIEERRMDTTGSGPVPSGLDADITTSIRSTLAGLRDEETRLLGERRDDYLRAQAVEQWLAFACLLGLACLGGIAWMLTRLRGREQDLIRTLDLGAFIVRDMDGTIKFWSAGCTQLYRWTSSEATGRRAHELLRTIFPAPLQEIEAVLREGREWAGYLSHVDRDGRRLLVFARMVLRRSGRHEELLESFSDATSQREAEALLTETAARLDLAIKVGQIGLSDWNFRTGAFVCNERMRELWALPEDAESAAKTFCSSLQPEDRQRHKSLVEQAAARSHPRVFEGEFVVTGRTDGVKRCIFLRGEVEVEDGEPSRLVETAIDVTLQREAEAVLARDKAVLEDLVAARTEALERAQERLSRSRHADSLAEFVAGIAHHFNNLLHAILASSDLMSERAEDSKAVRRLAGIVTDATLRGHDITSRLMTFARQNRLLEEEVDVASFLAEIRDMLIEERALAVTIQISVSENLPPLRADRTRLRSVLISLATNADEAMGGEGTLCLSATEESIEAEDEGSASTPPAGHYLCIAVADNGAGMDRATLARVAEPFFSTKEFGTGLGLGLAMSHGFLKQSGGTLSIESVPGEGTTVRLWFPILEDVIGQAALSISAPHAS